MKVEDALLVATAKDEPSPYEMAGAAYVLAREVERLQANTYCAYCGEGFAIDKGAEKVSAHISTCEKHPMRTLEAKIERLQQSIREAGGDLLRGDSNGAYDTLKEAAEAGREG